MAICDCGGAWNNGDASAGLMVRVMVDPPTGAYDDDASGCRHLEMFIYYADYHDVDEDFATILAQSGAWSWNEGVGLMRRELYQPLNYLGDDGVASSNMKKSLIMRIRIMSTKT